MADDEVATLTDGVADVMKVTTQQYRPASPIIDIYGDEEDSYDHGGTINVSLNCFYFLNKNRLLFFQNKCFSFFYFSWRQYCYVHVHASALYMGHGFLKE